MSDRSVRFGLCVFLLSIPLLIPAGELNPPAAPASTMITLEEIEPRTPVETLPGSSGAIHVIDQPGSYFLTQSLTGVSGKSGIVIAASHVTLDLMGFEIAGVTGSLCGIIVPSPEVSITIRNGSIHGWGEHGVEANAANGSQLLDLRALGNGTAPNDHDGLRLGQGGVIARCIARGHPAEGISADNGTSVIGCSASENTIGISGSAITATGCSATGNTFGGFSSSFGTIVGCNASFNDGYGFRIDRGSLIDCTATWNGTNGIWANEDSTVRGNTCSWNLSGAGIFAGSGPTSSRIEDNVVSGNDIGIQALSTNNLIIRNSARGNTTSNYSINAGNAYGPIVDVAGAGDMTTLVTTDHMHPWANFEY
ncbi:right-handed parallel beta-helix repeat-containing protein [Candidatus Sumerlaeota bacterium]|nr:right-handed parallel beta-helix repeat-containing protein [Candidatus Sumerlaeota bacterium]